MTAGYVKGASCPSKGEQHAYGPVEGKNYERCPRCGSTRTISRGSGSAPRAVRGVERLPQPAGPQAMVVAVERPASPEEDQNLRPQAICGRCNGPAVDRSDGLWVCKSCRRAPQFCPCGANPEYKPPTPPPSLEPKPEALPVIVKAPEGAAP